jgi:hypothetical protein
MLQRLAKTSILVSRLAHRNARIASFSTTPMFRRSASEDAFMKLVSILINVPALPPSSDYATFAGARTPTSNVDGGKCICLRWILFVH